MKDPKKFKERDHETDTNKKFIKNKKKKKASLKPVRPEKIKNKRKFYDEYYEEE